ncbi:MAG TPA: VOC family protein [Acidimicrobiales bacterium]
MSLRLQNISVDCRNAENLAGFWRDALGWRITSVEPEEVVLEPPVGSPEEGLVPDILFLLVPETKSTKNRLHFDLRPIDQDEEVERLENLGATRVDIGQTSDCTWVVLTDPEGNEFCVLRALTPSEQARLS